MTINAIGRLRRRLADVFTIHGQDATETHNIRYMLISGLVYGPVDGGIFNFLPVFLARLGASAATVSLLTSAPSILGIFSYIPGGMYAERQRDLPALLLRMGTLARLGYLLLALAPFVLPVSALPAAAIILWGWQAIPAAIHVPAWVAIMRQAIRPERRAQLNGTRWGLSSLASGATILLFGLLLDRTPFPLGYQVVFLASFIAGYLNLRYFCKVRVPPNMPAHTVAAGSGGVVARLRNLARPLIASRPFIRYHLATMGYRLALAMPAGLYSIFWVRELRATDSWIGLRGTAGYAALVIGYFLWGRVANRIGHRNLLVICGSGLALYPALTALAPSVEWLLPAALLWGLTVGGVDIGLFDMLLAACPKEHLPTAGAVAQVLTNIAVSIGPLLGAALTRAVDIRTALLVITVLQVLSVGCFLLLPTREQERAGE